MTPDEILKLWDAADKAGDVEAAKFLATEHQRASKGTKAANAAVPQEDRKKPVEGAGGAAFGVYPRQRATQSTGDNTNVIAGGLSSLVTAPSRAVAGIADAGVMAGRWAGKKLGVDVGEPPEMMSPAVSKLADALAGYKIPESVGRSAFEGAVTGPLSAGSKLAQAVAGAAAGGTAHAVGDAGGPWYAQLVAAILAAKTGAGATKAVSMSTAENLAKGTVGRASEGLTAADWATAREASSNASSRVKLFPSQALQVPAEGFQQLEAALLGSKASGTAGIRQQLRDQPPAVASMLEELRNFSGNRAGSSDLLAAKVQELAKSGLKAEGDAVNTATKPLYNAPDALAELRPQVVQNISKQLTDQFKTKALEYRATGGAVSALEEAHQKIQGILRHPSGAVRVEELQSAVADARAGLKSYTDLAPSQANRARQAVEEALGPLQAEIDRLSPSLKAARAMQKDLRTNLSGSYNDAYRQAKTGGGAETALNAAESRPELVASLGKQNPKIAQEVLQRQLENVIDSVSAPNPMTKLPSGQEGTRLQAALTQGLRGKAFDQNLELLFPGRPQAAEGFRALLDVAANASKPINAATTAARNTLPQELARGIVGGISVKAAAATRVLGGGMLRNLRDNATASILQSPDALKRLEWLASQSKTDLTPALIGATFPELVEQRNGP